MTVSYTNDGLDRFTLGDSVMANLSVEWRQDVPYAGKRGRAAAVANAEATVRRSDLEATTLAVLEEVKETYADLVRIDASRTIVSDGRKLLQSYVETARARYESGAGVLESVLRAQTEISRLDVALSALGRERTTSEARLAVLLGRRSSGGFGPATEPWVAADADADALAEAAVTRAPEVATRAAAVDRDVKRVDLAKRNLKPDFFWTAAYRNRGGIDPLVTGGVGLRLPLYRGRKQERAVAQAESELSASKADAEAAAVEAAAAVHDLAGRAADARRRLLLYREGVVPQAHSALDAAATAYAAGHVDFATLIDDFLELLDAQRSVETARADEAAALARLESLTGATLLTAGTGGRHE